MAEKWFAKDGRGPVLKEIAHENEAINRLHGEISARERRIDALEALLRYCECQKCGAELEGGIQAAQELADAAKSIGRADAPCVFCDSPEQTAAMEKALEVVA